MAKIEEKNEFVEIQNNGEIISTLNGKKNISAEGTLEISHIEANSEVSILQATQVKIGIINEWVKLTIADLKNINIEIQQLGKNASLVVESAENIDIEKLEANTTIICKVGTLHIVDMLAAESAQIESNDSIKIDSKRPASAKVDGFIYPDHGFVEETPELELDILPFVRTKYKIRTASGDTIVKTKVSNLKNSFYALSIAETDEHSELTTDETAEAHIDFGSSSSYGSAFASSKKRF